MKIFLTGGTGFIGSYVVHELVKNGHRVTILARNPHKVRGFLGNPSIELIQGTLYDRETIKNALDGKDACIHIALGWGDTAVDMLNADTLPSLYIFETAAKLGVKKLIYTSSIASYGDTGIPHSETSFTRPSTFYGATKASAESFLFAMTHVYGLRGNVVSPGYTFGNPVVDGASIYTDQSFRNIVKSAENNEPIRLVKNSGTQFIWAGDLAKIYAALVASEHNRRIFIGVSTEFTLWEEVARMAIEYIGSKSEIVLEDKGVKNENYPIDVSPIEREFGFKFVTKDRLKDHIAYLAGSGA